MASVFGRLFKETATYGISSIIGRFLNWLLTFIYIHVILQDELGRMTSLYAGIAILMVILTYGMETAFFRFSSTHERPKLVYSTALYSLATTSLLFVGLGYLLRGELTSFYHLEDLPLIVPMFLLIVALDAFTALPLAYLRYSQRPVRFMVVRMSFVLITVILTLFLFLGLPYLSEVYPSLFAGYFDKKYALYYILGINLFANVCQLIMLSPTIKQAEGGFDFSLWKKMIVYAFPMLLLGLAATFSNQADKIIFPKMFDDIKEGDTQLGIYSLGFKIAVILVMFTQAFRYAYEPFVFAKSKDNETDAKETYALSMRYYVLVTLIVFLGVMSYLDLVSIFVPNTYDSSFPVVPYILTAQVMLGISLNLSLWYKLKDMTYWGGILSVIACTVNVLMIIFFAKSWGFMACAWGAIAASTTMMLLSYGLGQKYYPINYPVKAIIFYASMLALALYLESYFATNFAGNSILLKLTFNTLIFSSFLGLILWKEVPRDLFKLNKHVNN